MVQQAQPPISGEEPTGVWPPAFGVSADHLRGELTEELVRAPATAEARLGIALGYGVPAAWSIFHDDLHPHLFLVASHFFAHDDDAMRVANAAKRRLYTERLDGGPPLPVEDDDDISVWSRARTNHPGIPLLPLLRAVLYEELLREVAIARDGARARELAAPHREMVERAARRSDLDLVAVAAGSPRVDEAHKIWEELEHALPTSLRDADVRTRFAQRRQNQTANRRPPTSNILNLPGLLVGAFLLMLAPTLFIALDHSGPSKDDLERTQLINLIQTGRFDEAVRALVQAPPKGMEGLRPTWPEQRQRRLQSLADRRPRLSPQIRIVSPRGPIDSERPEISIRVTQVEGEIRVRLFDADLGQVVLDEVMAAESGTFVPDQPLRRGGSFTLAVQSLGDGQEEAERARFTILTEEQRTEVEAELGRLMTLVGDEELFPFFAGHAYRARGCLEASLEAWERWVDDQSHREYALQEAALVLEDLELLHEAGEFARLALGS